MFYQEYNHVFMRFEAIGRPTHVPDTSEIIRHFPLDAYPDTLSVVNTPYRNCKVCELQHAMSMRSFLKARHDTREYLRKGVSRGVCHPNSIFSPSLSPKNRFVFCSTEPLNRMDTGMSYLRYRSITGGNTRRQNFALW